MNQTKRKIFLLDDDETFLNETKGVLEETGHQVCTCSRPLESIILVKEFNPDCLVLDLNMPLFDGEAFMPWLHRQFPDLAVIVCTGKEEFDKQIFLKLGVRYFIQKPFQLELLCISIENAVIE